MVGWTIKGPIPRQREKIYAILRAQDDWMVTLDIQEKCHDSGDDVINKIAIPTIRRCLQELRDHRPTLAREWRRPRLPLSKARFKIPTEWYGIKSDRNV